MFHVKHIPNQTAKYLPNVEHRRTLQQTTGANSVKLDLEYTSSLKKTI